MRFAEIEARGAHQIAHVLDQEHPIVNVQGVEGPIHHLCVEVTAFARVHLQELLLGMLAPALRRYRGHQDSRGSGVLQQILLDQIATHGVADQHRRFTQMLDRVRDLADGGLRTSRLDRGCEDVAFARLRDEPDLLERRLDDGAWPTGLASGVFGRVAGYRRIAHSRWGCR